MIYRVFIFHPGTSAYIGLWQPDTSSEWEKVDITQGSTSGQDVLRAIEELLTKAKISPKDLTHIGAMTGPASYTQLRVFIATVNALAWSLHLPIFSFSEKDNIPQDIPELITHAKVDFPLNPIYPHEIE